MKALATLADLHASIAWRLEGIDPETAETAAGAVFAIGSRGEAGQIDADTMAATLDGLGINHGGRPASLFHALRAIGADAAEAWHDFYPSAFLVFDAFQQAQRASGRRTPDALDRRIEVYLAEVEEITPAEIWTDMRYRADDRGDDVIVDFDSLAGVLSFQPDPDSIALADIRFEAFRRRVQRIRKNLVRQNSVSPLPMSCRQRSPGDSPAPVPQ